MIERRAGNAYAPRLCQALQARGDIYSVAIDIVSFNNNVAEIDAKAKPDLPSFGYTLVVPGHFPLDRRSTLDSIHDAGELDERAVSHEFDDATVELFDRGVDQFPTASLQPRQRAYLILSHEAAVADHVGSKYCRKPSLHTCALRLPCRSKRPLDSVFYSCSRCECAPPCIM